MSRPVDPCGETAALRGDCRCEEDDSGAAEWDGVMVDATGLLHDRVHREVGRYRVPSVHRVRSVLPPQPPRSPEQRIADRERIAPSPRMEDDDA